MSSVIPIMFVLFFDFFGMFHGETDKIIRHLSWFRSGVHFKCCGIILIILLTKRCFSWLVLPKIIQDEIILSIQSKKHLLYICYRSFVSWGREFLPKSIQVKLNYQNPKLQIHNVDFHQGFSWIITDFTEIKTCFEVDCKFRWVWSMEGQPRSWNR